MKLTFKFRIRKNYSKKVSFKITKVVAYHDRLIALYVFKFAFIIYIDKVLNTRALRYRMSQYFLKRINKARHWYRYNFDRSPYYYAYSSVDCDLVESSGVGRFNSYKEAYNYQSNPDNYDWLEGPYSEWEISKEEYLQSKGIAHQRDYIMEAYENGNGRKVLI